jgi:hypothetical protein
MRLVVPDLTLDWSCRRAAELIGHLAHAEPARDDLQEA